MSKIPNGVHETISRICIPKSPGCYYFSLSLHLSLRAHLGILDGIRKKWTSLVVSHTAREARHSLLHTHFPPRKSPMSRCLGEGVMPEEWNGSFTFLVYPISDFFVIVLKVCWDFSPWLPDFHRGTFICESLSKSMFFEGETVENYSTILWHNSLNCDF